MVSIYSTSNGIEANLLRDILQREGIAAHISGEYLQGGIGELPVTGLINVLVDEADSRRAEKIVRDWDQGVYTLEDKPD